MFKPRITGQRLRICYPVEMLTVVGIWYPMEVLTVLCPFVGLHCGFAYSSTGANNMFAP